jgi:hypothetical protein
VFGDLPVDVDELRGADDAALIDAVTGWARVGAAADARKYAAIAELARRRNTGEHARWACDDEAAAAAEVAAALNIGHGRASGEMDLAVVLRDRFPKVAALFLAGDVNARRVWLIANRTYLVSTPAAVAALDQVIADRITAWGPLTEDKLTQAIDVWVDRIDPAAVRRTRNSARSRDFTVADTDATGTAAVFGRLLGPDAALLKQRVAAMARGVCQDDPRTLAQRRSDALGALGAGSVVLSCACANPDCPAVVDDGRASSIVIHVIAEQSSTQATVDPHLHGEGLAPNTEDPDAPDDAHDADEAAEAADAPAVEPAVRRRAALLFGGGIVPAPLLAELIAHGATLKPVAGPGEAAEPRYRPSTALDEFVRTRDLTCRAPGCDRTAVFADIDHTVAYPAGVTHPGNLKCYCRIHHLIKTFWPGWSDRQLGDGTVVVTTPTAHTYTTRPASSLFFPGWAISTPAPPATPAAPGEHRTLMMPTRKRTRAQARADRIKTERALNDAHLAERNTPPPF